jgi:sugar transferase (PEP-CTERM system associated)
MLELFRSPRRATVWFIEATLLAMLAVVAFGAQVGWEQAREGEVVSRALVVSLVTQASLYYHGLYARDVLSGRAMVLSMFRALGIAAALLTAMFYALADARFGVAVFAAALGSAAFVLPAWRSAYRRLSHSAAFRRSAIVLGSGELGRECADILRGENDLGLELAGVLVRDDEPASGPDVLGRYDDLARIVAERNVALVVVAYADRRGAFPAEELLNLKFQGVDVEEGVDFYERMTGKLYVRALRPSQLIFSSGFHVRRRAYVVKRIFDVTCAALGLVLSSPLVILTAIAIRLESRGPIFYSQIRAGALGKPFTILKLRSMRVDAEAGGARFAEALDPRVTRVGRFIRATRIDELPQLWNVFVGDMSMVGPRPERPVFIEQLERQVPFFRQRLCVKPGVTGHAQVRCRYGASTEDHLEKLQHDLFYIKSFSLWFDLSILLDTVKVVLLRIGAR